MSAPTLNGLFTYCLTLTNLGRITVESPNQQLKVIIETKPTPKQIDAYSVVRRPSDSTSSYIQYLFICKLFQSITQPLSGNRNITSAKRPKYLVRGKIRIPATRLRRECQCSQDRGAEGRISTLPHRLELAGAHRSDQPAGERMVRPCGQ